MKFHLEATLAELWQKGDLLVEKLVNAFSDTNPDLADNLEKALPPKEQDLKYPALQGLRDITTREYEAMLKRMLTEVGKVLDQSVSGPSAVTTELSKAEKLTKQEEEEEEKLEPGDVDPETGELIPEPEDEEEEEEEEEEEKSLPQSEPLEHDFTKPIAEKDGRAYARMKRVLMGRGYVESDFEEGGPLYGYSVNELIDLVREARKAS